LKRKSRLKSTKKRGIISTIPKRKKLTTTTHPTIKTYQSAWRESPGWNINKKERMVSTVLKKGN
jgi:hypothetical protein